MSGVEVSDIEKMARLLSPEDRARLAQILLDSLRTPELDEIESAWKREIDARTAAYERGEIKTYAAEEVLAEARRLTS